jgi:hypothetical protein
MFWRQDIELLGPLFAKWLALNVFGNFNGLLKKKR